MLISPYDTDARYGEKRGHGWSGYKVHVSETCDNTPAPDAGADQPPNLITNVVTTHAAVADTGDDPTDPPDARRPGPATR
jgi:hypothetical protein